MATHHNLSDSLYGERIAVQTRKFQKKNQIKVASGMQFAYKFSKFAYCVIEKVLQQTPPNKPSNWYFSKAEAIEGRIISGQADNNTRPTVTEGLTSTHGGQLLSIYGDAFCTIELPLIWKGTN